MRTDDLLPGRRVLWRGWEPISLEDIPHGLIAECRPAMSSSPSPLHGRCYRLVLLNMGTSAPHRNATISGGFRPSAQSSSRGNAGREPYRARRSSARLWACSSGVSPVRSLTAYGGLLDTWMWVKLQRITRVPHCANVVWPDLGSHRVVESNNLIMFLSLLRCI